MIVCILSVPNQCSAENILDELLANRIEIIRDQFRDLENTKTPHVINSSLDVIKCTLVQVSEIFTDSVLDEVLSDLVEGSSDVTKMIIGTSNFRLFTANLNVSKFKFVISGDKYGIDKHILQEKMERWWNEVCHVMQDRVRLALEKINNVRELTVVKSEAWKHIEASKWNLVILI